MTSDAWSLWWKASGHRLDVDECETAHMDDLLSVSQSINRRNFSSSNLAILRCSLTMYRAGHALLSVELLAGNPSSISVDKCSGLVRTRLPNKEIYLITGNLKHDFLFLRFQSDYSQLHFVLL